MILVLELDKDAVFNEFVT